MDAQAARALVRAFVRGEVEESELAVLGVKVSWSGTGCTIEEPAGIPYLEPSIKDIATGTIAHWARSTSLCDWARVVLGANFIDLTQLEDDPDGEHVLDALWIAPAGDHLRDGDLELLRALSADKLSGAGDGDG